MGWGRGAMAPAVRQGLGDPGARGPGPRRTAAPAASVAGVEETVAVAEAVAS